MCPHQFAYLVQNPFPSCVRQGGDETGRTHAINDHLRWTSVIVAELCKLQAA